jgi:hypothetical protein
MTQRAERLMTAAATQVVECIDLVSATDDATLHRPCPGREKLGDGSIGAVAAHTADNYERIGTFVATSQRETQRHGRQQPGRHRIPRVLGGFGHRPPDHGQNEAAGHTEQDTYTADTARSTDITQQLTAAGENLERIGQLTDQQLDAVPPKGRFRFCDGQRSLEQVLAGLLKHQEQQLQALRAALA